MRIEEIRNMEIKPGIHQWDGVDNGMTSGHVDINLPNGTVIQIQVTGFQDETYICEMRIHNLKDTKLTIFDKVSKAISKFHNTLWTVIKVKKTKTGDVRVKRDISLEANPTHGHKEE